MNIAILYTGFMRTWQLCKPNQYEYIITPESDLYFYTYTHEDPHYKDSDNKAYFTRCHQPFFPDPFAPHKFQERKRPETQVYNTFNMWINMLIGFALIPEKYDIVVRCRPDLKFNGKLNYHEYTYDDNTVYIPQGMDYWGLNDQFAFGSYNAMKKYFQVLLNAHTLWHEGVEFNAEIMLKAHLESVGVKVVRIGSPQHDLVR